MCGIVAIKWTNLPPALSVIHQSIEMLCNRGKDSWGIAIGREGFPLDTIVVKKASRINIRKNKKMIFKILQKFKSNGWLLLHSRLATNGFSGLSDHNHPIEFGHIRLVHNGLVVVWPGKVRQIIDESSTDSQNLAVIIASSDPSELETILNETIGEISLVWQNSVDNTFNMYTNVGGLYVETKPDYTLVTSEPIQSLSSRVMRGKIIEL